MELDFHRHLQDAVAGQGSCVREECPVGASGMASLARQLEAGASPEAWERVLAAAQTTTLCDDTCPACDGLVALLNDLTFRQGVGPSV